ncbi:class I SAM-dependent methyltransferase [Tepidicaulis sp. LMO-SS28]|uniref:class I SAM-dependent methyltransferase n=1 Tax=Tepidicaulis sp. LMO-SS28 TaxID=3447455 RepID=UPI003EE1E29F
MHMDVVDLRDFYARPLGRMVRRHLGRRIREIWPDVMRMDVAGLGYATPYLRHFLDEAERVLALMPAQQGVIYWPKEGPNRTALIEDTDWPLPDDSLDRLLLVHTVENSEALGAMLRQAWRVLKPGGRLLIVTPNRRGIWARREATPFGHGRPFTRGQLMRLLRDSMFAPTDWSAALYFLPFDWRPLLRWAGGFESGLKMFGPRFAGVLLVEAAKQFYAGTPVKVRPSRAKVALPGFRPVAVPRIGGNHPYSSSNS